MSSKLLIVAAATLLVSETAPASDRFSVNSHMVMVPVTVTDRNGKAIDGLGRDHFQVVEDSEKREILSVTKEESAMALGMVLDLSGSMRDKVSYAIGAAREIAEQAEDRDELFLMTFGDRSEMRVPITREHRGIAGSLTGAQAGGSTALIDSIYRALHEVRRSTNKRRGLIVVSDGGDNASRYSASELKHLVRETDVQIYSVSVIERPMDRDARRGDSLLEDLATTTGGLHFTVRDHRDLPVIAEKLARAMKEVYVIGYKPREAMPGKWRKIRVSVTSLPSRVVRVSARSGYYSAE